MKEQKLRRVKEAITHCYECFMKDTILNSSKDSWSDQQKLNLIAILSTF